jgi:hypothetical protein
MIKANGGELKAQEKRIGSRILLSVDGLIFLIMFVSFKMH